MNDRLLEFILNNQEFIENNPEFKKCIDDIKEFDINCIKFCYSNILKLLSYYQNPDLRRENNFSKDQKVLIYGINELERIINLLGGEEFRDYYIDSINEIEQVKLNMENPELYNISIEELLDINIKEKITLENINKFESILSIFLNRYREE